MKGGRVRCIGPPGEVLPRVEEQLTGDLEKRPPGGKADVKAERGENKEAVENEVILFKYTIHHYEFQLMSKNLVQ